MRSSALTTSQDAFAALVAEARRLPPADRSYALTALMRDAIRETKHRLGYLDASDLGQFGFTAAEVIEYVGAAIAAALPEAEAA